MLWSERKLSLQTSTTQINSDTVDYTTVMQEFHLIIKNEKETSNQWGKKYK